MNQSKQQSSSLAADRALKAAVDCSLAMLLKARRTKSHRAPSKAVMAKIHKYQLPLAVSLLVERLQEFAESTRKLPRNWSSDDVASALKYAADVLHAAKLQMVKGRGRPRGPIRRSGLINDAWRRLLDEDAKTRRERIKRFANRYVESEIYYKLGAFAGRQCKLLEQQGFDEEDAMRRTFGFDAIFKYMRNSDMLQPREHEERIIPSEIRRLRVPKGLLEELMQGAGLSPRDLPSVKMAIARRRKEI